jgi:hypothetical protein
MKLKINEKYADVDFWSFLKCHFLVSLALTGMAYGAMIILMLLFGLMLL